MQERTIEEIERQLEGLSRKRNSLPAFTSFDNEPTHDIKNIKT